MMWTLALVALLFAYRAAHSPLVPCVLGGCSTLSPVDAVMGLLAALEPDYTVLTANQTEEIGKEREKKARLIKAVSQWVAYFDPKDLRCQIKQAEAPGTQWNNNMPVQVSVITKLPSATGTSTNKKPLLILFHGGGMVFGESVDSLAINFAANTDGVVVSPDYRLAPEFPYPQGVEDSYAALLWAVANAEALGADPKQLYVGGVSAGALITAVVTHMAKDRYGPTIRAQVLLAPMLTPAVTASRLKFWDDHNGLSSKAISWMWHMYIGSNAVDTQRCTNDWRCSPLAAKSFGGLPPALVALGSSDVLRSEGEAYVERLRADGVAVDVLHMRGSHFAIAFDGNNYRLVEKLQHLVHVN